MKQATGLSVIVLSLIACGCKPKPAADDASLAPLPPSAPPEQLEAESGLAVKRGVITFNGDAPSYRACGANATVALADATDNVKHIYAKLGGKPLYAEAYGELKSNAFALEELLYATPRDPSAACAASPGKYELLASGGEPAWSVSVTQDSMIFRQSAEPKEIIFTAVETTDAEGAVIYRAGVDKHVLELTVKQNPCEDGGAYFGYSAAAQLDKRTLNGCARVGD